MSKAKLLAVGVASAAIGAGGSQIYSSYAQEAQKQPRNLKSAAPAATTRAIPVVASTDSPVIATKGLPVQPTPGIQIVTQNQNLIPVDPTGILKYGSPGPVLDEVKSLALYGAYDRRTRNPWWIAEHITAESVAENNSKRKDAFSEDKDIPELFRAKMADYHKSGYDRGHQAPAGNASWSQEAMDGTFKLSNMCPQVGEGFNRSYWARFEKFCRNLTQRYPSVRVITGPLYLPTKDEDDKYRVHYEVIGEPPNVAVPTHFYKIVIGEDEDTADELDKSVAIGAFVLPNARIDSKKLLKDFEVDVGVVERASGLEFARNLVSDKRKKLCEEVKCDVAVQSFGKAVEKAKL